MTIKLGLIVLGAMLIYGSWKDLSIRALIFGDNNTSGNHPVGATATAASTSTSNPTLPPGQSTSGQSSPAGPGAAATTGTVTPTQEQLRTGFGRG